MGIESKFDSPLYGGLDVFKCVGNTAGSDGSTSCHVGFVDDDGRTEFVEDSLDKSLLRFFHLVVEADKCRTLLDADGGIGDDTSHRTLISSHEFAELGEGDTGSDADDERIAGIDGRINFFEYLLHKPWLDAKHNNSGSLTSLTIGKGGVNVGHIG